MYIEDKVEDDSEYFTIPPPSLREYGGNVRIKEIIAATRNKRDATDFEESPSDGEDRPTTNYPLWVTGNKFVYLFHWISSLDMSLTSASYLYESKQYLLFRFLSRLTN